MTFQGWQLAPVMLFQLVLLAGCGTPAPAPVLERPQPPSEKINFHIVSSGETLYSIAWRYELDFSRLAAVNGLQQPFTLRPGQRLSLDMNKPPPVRSSGATSYPVREGAVTSGPEIETEPVKPAEPAPPRQSLPAGGWRWQWPANGDVVREYDVGRALKGISIYTSPGASVEAAAPGVVVYAGNGLRGYGNLLIIKHSDAYLSAYAHNKRLLVGESDPIRSGQRIAEVGVDASRKNRLYFEIRENGKPVDPLGLLPKK